PVLADVAAVAAHLLVAAGAEGLATGAGQQDDTDFVVLVGDVERLEQLEDGLGPEGVAHLRSVDGDAGDPLEALVEDVLELADPTPVVRQSRPPGGSCSARPRTRPAARGGRCGQPRARRPAPRPAARPPSPGRAGSTSRRAGRRPAASAVRARRAGAAAAL